MSDKKQGGDKPPNYDYTSATRQRRSNARRARAYMIIKAVAQRTGYMANALDVDGLDKFLDKFAVEGHEIDWFEAASDL